METLLTLFHRLCNLFSQPRPAKLRKSHSSSGSSSILRMGELGKTTPTVSAPARGPVFTTIDFTSVNTLIIASVAVAGVSWLPYEEDAAGNRVPTIIFRGQPYFFQTFVMLIMFGFSTSFCALFSYNRPKVARFLRSLSVVFLSSAAAVLLFVVCWGSMFNPSAPHLLGRVRKK